ncbi:MAG: hypothetical protein ACJ72R_14490 [Nitrososphaeraceae archaeon]
MTMLSGFYLRKSKENLKSSNSNEDEKEGSNEPDYNEDKDQIEEKQEETVEITTNQVFLKERTKNIQYIMRIVKTQPKCE